MNQNYLCIENGSGDSFGVGRYGDIAFWRETAMNWHSEDGDSESSEVVRNLPDEEVISYTAMVWDITIILVRTIRDDDVLTIRCIDSNYDINLVDYYDTVFVLYNKTDSDLRLDFPKCTDDFSDEDNIYLPAYKQVELSWGDVGINWFQALEQGDYEIGEENKKAEVA
jgi:hypothetical protein